MIAPDTSGLKMHGVEELWERAFWLIRAPSCYSQGAPRWISNSSHGAPAGGAYSTSPKTGLPVAVVTPELVWANLTRRFPLPRGDFLLVLHGYNSCQKCYSALFSQKI